jgi:hypothetical protein
MITGRWWRTLKGQPRHPPHNNVGSTSHLVGGGGGGMLCLRRLPAFNKQQHFRGPNLSRTHGSGYLVLLHRMSGNQTFKDNGRELPE